MARYSVMYNTTAGRLEYQTPDRLWTAAAAGGGGSGAPTNAEYVTTATNATLTNERVLGVAGAGLALDTSVAGAATVQTDFTTNHVLLGRDTAGAGLGEEVGLSDVLDWANGGTRGAILYRGAGGWIERTPGTSGYILTSQGAGADPVYAAIGTALNVLSTTQGAIITRGAATWSTITPGTSGYVLTSQGPGADLIWQAASGGITSHTGLSDLGWTSSDHTGAASNLAGFDGSGATSYYTASEVLNLISTTQGAVLYRGAASWAALAAGTSGYLLKANGAGADPAWVDPAPYLGGLLLPPRVGTVVKTRMWSQVGATGSGSTGFVGNLAIFVLHFDPHGLTYDALETRVITTAGTSKYRIAVYTHGSDGQPDVLLWTGNEIDSGTATGSAGTKTQTFASDGTWVASPGSYKDGSDRLELQPGQSVWVVYLCQGTASMRNVALASCRSLGHDPADATPVTGLTAALTFTTPASAYPADTSALTFADRKSDLPFIGLREI